MKVSHDDGLYRVRSQYDDKIYTVEVNHGNPHCTCPDNERTIFCKHSIASMMVTHEQEQKAPVLTVKETAHTEFVKASWVVTDGTLYTNVWQDLNGKICCVCGAYYKRDCIHKQAIRDYYDDGNGSKRIENDCGTSEAKSLQDNLNGNNGTGDTQSPVHYQLNTSDPFQESEQLDIDQIEGRANGDLVHILSNGEYVISYNGIMRLADKHGVAFYQHSDEREAIDTHTVIAYARCGSNTRTSGKPMNGSFTTAVELAKRNAARQLLPYAEVKAIEYKAKLEAEFDWQKAKAKCVEIVPEFKLSIIINDLVTEGTLKQAHPSDYNRKEWLMIFDACRGDIRVRAVRCASDAFREHASSSPSAKKDAETNGNDDDGVETHGEAARLRLCAPGDNTPSSDEQVTCCICGRTLTNKLSISRCVGPECFKKVGAKGRDDKPSRQFLQDDEVSEELIAEGLQSDGTAKASQLY